MKQHVFKWLPPVILTLVTAFLVTGLWRWQDLHPPRTEEFQPSGPGPRLLQPQNTAQLLKQWQQWDYSRQTLEQGVPNFRLTHFPQDLVQQPVHIKKQVFYLGLLPMVLQENRRIAGQRRKLQKLLQRQQLTPEQQQWLSQLAQKYKVDSQPHRNSKARSKLLHRVDIVPVDLVLAQAANESAYGNSRFARQANNLFGQWTYQKGQGLVPKDRPEGASYEVKLFSDLNASIRGYMHNLNTNGAYAALRRRRQRLRQQGKNLQGWHLAAGLQKYSARGQQYIEEIRAMIRHNDLKQFNQAQLRRVPRSG